MKQKNVSVICLLLMLSLLLLCACGDSGSQTGTAAPVTAEPTGNTAPTQAPSATTVFGSAAVEEETSSIPATSDEVFHVMLDSEPKALYTQFGNMNQPMITVAGCMYEYLVYWNSATETLIPGLATSWENIDETHWRLHLQEGVTAENGSEFTAEDVRYSFQVGCDGTDVSSYARVFNMDEFQVEDDHTIVIATLSPSPKLMELLTKSCYAMISKSCVDEAGGIETQQLDAHCGTGKYVLDEWVSGQYIRLVRNENYWDQDNNPAYFAAVEFSFTGDAATRLMGLQSGDADYTYGLTATQILGLADSQDIRGYAYKTPGAEVISFNCGRAPFNDERVREAFYYLIDPEECMLLATNGLSTVSNSMLGTTNIYYSAPEELERSVDVEKAKALLAEAGYPDGLTVTLQYSGNSPIYEIIQNELSKGGITLELVPVEYATVKVAQRTGDYDLTIGPLKTADIIQTFGTLDARIGYAQNAGGCQCSDEALYAILDKVYHEFDEDAAAAYYAELQDYVREHNIIIGLYDTLTYAAISQEYSDPNFDLAGSVSLANVHRIA